MGFKTAKREKLKARIGICAPSGAGKTYSSLLLASGLANGGKILFADSEKRKSRMHVGKPGIPKYEIEDISKPYTPQRYIEVMSEAIAEKPEVLIVDSLSHAWAGPGGILEMVDRVKSGGNNFTAWRTLTPLHNKLVDFILDLPFHVIVTMRTKTEYVTEKNDQGKAVPRKVGLAPVQRDGMEYEFDIVFDIDQDTHLARASKDRTSLFDANMGEILTAQHGVLLREWLDSGAEAEVVEAPAEVIVGELITQAARNRLNTLAIEAKYANLTEAMQVLKVTKLDTMDDAKNLAAMFDALETKKAS